MRRLLLTLTLAPALLSAQSTPPAPAPRPDAVALTTAQEMDRAWFTWEAGKYEDALTGLLRVLRSADADLFQHAAAMQFSGLSTYRAFSLRSTDAPALSDGWGDIVGGIGSYPILGNPHYHQVHDVLETINHQQIAETSRATVATIMLLASSPSRLAGLKASGTQATLTASPEKGVNRYLVRWGPANDPGRHSAIATAPRATLAGAQPGWEVAVKAVNAAGLEGWDWARADVR